MVASLDHQVRPYLSAIPLEHTRTKRPARCRSRQHAHTEPG
jgi:hypothetical protein